MKSMHAITKLSMMERMHRGGLCFECSKGCVKTNNKYMPEYNPTHDPNQICYVGANNLYACSMTEHLPDQNL